MGVCNKGKIGKANWNYGTCSCIALEFYFDSARKGAWENWAKQNRVGFSKDVSCMRFQFKKLIGCFILDHTENGWKHCALKGRNQKIVDKSDDSGQTSVQFNNSLKSQESDRTGREGVNMKHGNFYLSIWISLIWGEKYLTRWKLSSFNLMTS